MNKINVLEGEWLGCDYHESILPELEQAQIPTFKYEIIPVSRLHDDSYWLKLRQNPNTHFAVIDPKLWHFDDLVFIKYVQLFSSVEFPVVCVAESLCEDIPGVPVESYFKKFFERTDTIVTSVRKNYPATVILSPPIDVVKSEYLNYCVDYFIHNRNLFDGYAVCCVNDIQEHTLGKLTSLLHQVMKILPKEIWVTKWAIPSFEGKLRSDTIIGASDWEPWDYRAAELRMIRSFKFIDSAASHGSKWFYAGMGKDLYYPRLLPGPHEFWSPIPMPISRSSYSYKWNFSHFLGMMTMSDDIKCSLLDAFIKFAKNHNV